MISLLATWAVGLCCLSLLFYPIFGKRGENSTRGAGRHAAEFSTTTANNAARTTVRQRFGNLFSSFVVQDWSLLICGMGFTLVALAQSCRALFS